jgi:adenylate cyclase, class 2
LRRGLDGVRLYRDRDGRYQVGVCIQRMDLCRPLDEFLDSDLHAEIVRLRQQDFAWLAAEAGPLTSTPATDEEKRVPIEHEAKVLAIDPMATAALIVAKGGEPVGESKLMRRYVYDITPGDETKWIRLRDTGSEITLCVKEIRRDAIDGTHEVEVTVDDFAATNELLVLLGFSPKSYQENRRTSFTLDGARLEIDEWPRIPPYLEIEADSRDEVVRVAALLDCPEDQLTAENTMKVYARYAIDLGAIPELYF